MARQVPDLRVPVLVTGGAGYIGSHAVLALLDSGWPVVVLDNLRTGFRWAVDSRATFIEGDVADEQLVTDILDEYEIGAVMHFAGSIVVPESVADPIGYYRNNTSASRNLIAACIAAGVRHFLFSSTAATYGNPRGTAPVRESCAPRPISPYGRSKLMTEWMLKDAAAAHQFNYGVLRYFNVAGADPRGRSGQSTVGATHLVKVAVEAVVGKRDHVAIFGTDYATPDGTGIRDYIHVSDLAAAHVDALRALLAAPCRSLLLNVGYGRGSSVLEVLDAVERVSGRKIEREVRSRRPGDPARIVADNRAILKCLPWRPCHDDLERIVADALAWEQAHLTLAVRVDATVQPFIGNDTAAARNPVGIAPRIRARRRSIPLDRLRQDGRKA